MIFKEGNKIKYGQDFGFYQGVPANVDFKVSYFTTFGGEVDKEKFELVAYGYGQLKPWFHDSYGNGSLTVYGLTQEEKEMFEKEIGKEVQHHKTCPTCGHLI